MEMPAFSFSKIGVCTKVNRGDHRLQNGDEAEFPKMKMKEIKGTYQTKVGRPTSRFRREPREDQQSTSQLQEFDQHDFKPLGF